MKFDHQAFFVVLGSGIAIAYGIKHRIDHPEDYKDEDIEDRW